MDLTDPKGEHYNVRWNNYSNNLINVFSEHQHHETLVDVTLICEGRYVKAHKLILSACSGFFQEMFKDYSHVSNPFIVLSGIKLAHLTHIIEFIYKGEIRVLDSDLESVLALGEHFQVKGLCSVKVSTPLNDSNSLPATIADPTSTKLPMPNPSEVNSSQSKIINDNNIQKSSETDKEGKAVIKPITRILPSHTSPHQTLLENNSKNRCTPPADSGQPVRKKIKTEIAAKEEGAANENKIPLKSVSMSKENKTLKDSKDSINKDSSTRLSPPVPTTATNLTKESIPRPANAFMIFATEWRKKLAVEHPGDNSKSISVRLGNLWKSLSAETRESYYSAARQAQLEHQLKYPGYYVPIPTSTRMKVTNRRKTADGVHYRSTEESKGSDDDLQIIEDQVEEAADVANLPSSSPPCKGIS
ncbi:hypothetical protein JTB14_021005 [Gonioctena quinquepunctata]|nr:hypothetical protein JTB14_021005 [Gonioctena quinquepunctata]